ncbi:MULTISPECIES: nucleotide exchange factor GrpE [unclassified Saccharibacter]|uniref:nucleotide exchange factor GrpE n=1 Tax=unclassified Saccharibacter TaxID=2648722 RepID=UPI001354D98A|nr:MULTISPECIES: nucleotide exchange factor GrpE [unclassified Saccharibacter]MXV58762.1 nucleotide exchange factor GrpE [Saccharibacter sp. EH70]MXV65626.1 nucleotide exchange factor GrpE [Saccharibacter sp. EH60]
MTEQNPHTETDETAGARAAAEAAAALDEQKEGEKPAADASPEERIAALEAEVEEMKNRWLRSEADNQNLRTRAKRDLDDARQYAVQKFARDVVEAAENLQRGVASLPEPKEGEDKIITSIREGLEGTERSFLAILERNGITRQDATGQAFDANLHQAMQEVESPDHAPGYVVQAWTPTWMLKDRLLKPAMVLVANSDSKGKKPE